MLSVVPRSEWPSKACAVLIDYPTSVSNVACVPRVERLRDTAPSTLARAGVAEQENRIGARPEEIPSCGFESRAPDSYALLTTVDIDSGRAAVS